MGAEPAHELPADDAAPFEARLEARLAARARSGRPRDGFKGRKVVGEVLDRTTVHELYAMIRSGTLARVHGAIRSGKESVVFWAEDPDGADVALKIYLVATSNFKRRALYMDGDPRFAAVRGGTRGMVYAWAQKEFRNLTHATARGVRVPRPLRVSKNVLAMEFVGSRGSPAPTLRECEVGEADYAAAIAAAESLYCGASLVHGDLSEYNMLKERGGLVVFDLASAVSVRHPAARALLKRDIANVTRFFSKRGIDTEDSADVLARIMR